VITSIRCRSHQRLNREDPQGRQRPALPAAAGTDVIDLNAAVLGRTVGSTVVIRVIPAGEDPSMAQLRWQKPANGSDTLAIAQIRCQRTFPQSPPVSHLCSSLPLP